MPACVKRSFSCFASIFLASVTSAADLQSENHSVQRVVDAFQHSIRTEAKPQFSILKSLDFKSKSYQETNRAIGAKYTYPQGFQVDDSRDLLYVVRYSNGHPARGVIEKYRWGSGEQLATYIIAEPQNSISEGLVVREEAGVEMAYLRSDNMLTRYRLVEGRGGAGTAEKLGSLAKNVAQSFYEKGGRWYLEKFKTARDSIGQSRGEYEVLDKKFGHIKDISFPSQYSGYRESEKFDLPKHQGFSVLDDGFVMSMGGYWAKGEKITPYNYFGVNVFNVRGEVVGSEYVSPDLFISQLAGLGVEADTVENEGIQALQDGTLVVFQVVRMKNNANGKLLFLKLDLEH